MNKLLRRQANSLASFSEADIELMREAGYDAQLAFDEVGTLRVIWYPISGVDTP